MNIEGRREMEGRCPTSSCIAYHFLNTSRNLLFQSIVNLVLMKIVVFLGRSEVAHWDRPSGVVA